MNRNEREAGVALIISVLLAMLMLAGVLLVTAQLALSSRRGTADQRATLQAQYAAESHLALALERIGNMESVMKRSNMTISSDIKPGKIASLAAQFCGGAVFRDVNYISTCLASEATKPIEYDVFAQMVTDYSDLPANERPASTDLASRQAWWNRELGNTVILPGGVDGFNTTYQLVADKVERRSPTEFRFFLKLASLTAQGKTQQAFRQIKAGLAASTGWYIDISKPAFLDDVLFTNHHRQATNSATGTPDNPITPDVDFITGQTFNGTVHTNESFRFGGGAKPTFQDNVTSAGCTDLSTAGSVVCDKSPRVYVNGESYEPAPTTASDDVTDDLLAQLKAQGVEPNFQSVDPNAPNPKPDFKAPYRPLPTNVINQRSAADGVPGPDGVDPQGKGLNLTPTPLGPVLGVKLYTGDDSGNFTGTYNAAKKQWPSQNYQFIEVQTSADIATNAVYRVGADRRIEKKNPLNTATGWDKLPQLFNGVIYSEQGIQNLKGPERIGSGSPTVNYAPPALASFMKMTIATNGPITIDGDLTLADQPCAKPTNAQTALCSAEGKGVPQAVLGIYAQQGDIKISKRLTDPNIQAMMIASEGAVSVEDYDKDASKGTVHLTGGIVENWYGAFGTYDRTSLAVQTGYSRDFNYDPRFALDNFSPPFFPVSPIWIPNDALSKPDDPVRRLSLTNIVRRQGDGS